MRIVQGSFGSWQCVVRTCTEDTYVSNNIFHVRRRCKLKLIYNSGSPTRHDFVLAAKQTLLPLPTTWLSRANNYAKLPVLGRIARILSILSTPFLTFTDAFLRYGATIREREREREILDECTCCCCANRGFQVFWIDDVYRNFRDDGYRLFIQNILNIVNILKNVIINYPCMIVFHIFSSIKKIEFVLLIDLFKVHYSSQFPFSLSLKLVRVRALMHCNKYLEKWVLKF